MKVRDMHSQRLRNNGTLDAERREAHGLTDSAEYQAWISMKDRCLNARDGMYKHYGGRGIQVCVEWQESFLAFLGHIGQRPTPEHSLDRIDVDGNYEPGNVRWATSSVQALNKRIRNKTGYRGVFYDARVDKYQARIHRRPAPQKTLGVYRTAIEAAYAYDAAAHELFGEDAPLNFPGGIVVAFELCRWCGQSSLPGHPAGVTKSKWRCTDCRGWQDDEFAPDDLQIEEA